MDYIKTYKSFINSQQLSEGIRITIGVLLPALVFSYFNMLSVGIIVSLGALFVSVTDNPGPIHHRKNGMTVCIVAIVIGTLITGFAANSSIGLGLFLFTSCFFFSMLSIYGTRAASIGTATMLVIILTIDPHVNLDTPVKILQHSFYLGLGGVWYMCFSMLLYNFRPYRLAQQALGECIQATSEYLSIRAELYKKDANYESAFKRLLQQQADVQHKQTELAELLFKTRSIVKESTNIGRSLVMIHLDVADIFERIMMSYQEYPLLHQYFDETGILDDYYNLAKSLADEMEEIGLAVKSGEASKPRRDLIDNISKTRDKLDGLRLTYLKPTNIEGFISLRRILENIQDLAERLNTLHQYTRFENQARQPKMKNSDYENLISSNEIRPQQFIDNLSLKSDTFRHSLRVSIALVAGFILARFLKIGHSYWVLLTIIVILKPAFSLTKKRNASRLGGTAIGILLGVIIIHTVFNNTVLLVLMALSMAAAYSFMRTNYFMMVLLITIYLLIFYHLLNPSNFNILLKDRVVDTLIGSVIATIASFVLFPSWEREKFKPTMVTMLAEVKDYFCVITDALTGKKTDRSAQQVARKNALVALANLSDAFNRMLSEPKTQQVGIEALHQFVVLNHMLASYIATLSHYIQPNNLPANADEFITVANDIQHYLTNAIEHLKNESETEKALSNKEALRKLNEHSNQLLQKRREELEKGMLETSTRKRLFDLKSIVDQFNLIYNVAVDLNKITQTLKIE
jgi:uncharacterized membrane protein YccC